MHLDFFSPTEMTLGNTLLAWKYKSTPTCSIYQSVFSPLRATNAPTRSSGTAINICSRVASFHKMRPVSIPVYTEGGPLPNQLTHLRQTTIGPGKVILETKGLNNDLRGAQGVVLPDGGIFQPKRVKIEMEGILLIPTYKSCPLCISQLVPPSVDLNPIKATI